MSILLTIEDRAQLAMDRLREFEPRALKMDPAGYYVAFSGGKDSIVILDLVRRSGVKHDVHFHVTSVDPPEILAFIRQHYPGVQWHRPGKNNMFALIVKKMMPPTRLVRYCCGYLKEHGGDGRMVVTGVRWAESLKRSKRRMVEPCFRNKTKMFMNPIIDWQDDDVWEYIHSRNMPYPSLYSEGFKRIGCVGCPMAADSRAKEFARWPHYERAYRRAFAKAVKAKNAAKLDADWASKHPRLISWDTAEQMWDWWMDERRQAQDPDQTVMFE